MSSASSTTAARTPSPTPSQPELAAPTLEPIKTAATTGGLSRVASHAPSIEEELIQVLSRRRTQHSAGGGGETNAEAEHEIERLLSRIFGQTRQAASEEEKTRHTGVVFRDLTVLGEGLGASLQPTNSDFLLGPLRGLAKLLEGQAFRKPPVRTLINEFTGCVRPSEMLLVLGRPGSGCSTFLKVIGNQRSGFVKVDGSVTYGGTDAKDMAKNYRGEVLYNPEEDLHYATLTVRDTLRFALQTRTPGKESRAEGESRESYVREFLRVVSKLFWIEHTLDTKLGNAIVRGVSGGEKKRVSIAEAMVTKASCQCWDNSTKGLDASTAMEYVSSLRSLTNMAGISTLVALYQAGESLYELFDKVLVIDQGRCAYFGKAEDAKQYFEDLGFICPTRWTTADFLTSVTDPHERHLKEGWENRIPRTAEEFETAFRNSKAYEANLRDIEGFEETIKEQVETRAREISSATKRKNYTISFQKQVIACTSRQFKVMLGDKLSLGARWLGLGFQSLIVGSLFFNMPDNALGVFPRGGVLFFTLLFNALLALAEMTAAFDSRPILMKHKAFSFYRPSAYAIAQVVADIPLCAMQVLIWGIIVYFMSNLRRTASQFFIFILVSFFLALSMYSFFRMISAFSESLDSATQVTGVCIQALIVYTGYLIPPTSMHPWFSWLRWINPVQYSFEAVMANEFYDITIQCVPPYLVPAGGPGVTPESQSCLIQGSTPGSTMVNGADYIKTQYNYTRDHLWRNVGIIIAFWIFFATMTAVGLELQKPNNGGAAVTVFKRGQTPDHVEEALNKGAPPPGDEEKAEKGTASATGLDQHTGTRDVVTQVAKNDTIFTWQNVTYTIPTKNGEKILLDNVSGFVRPGKLTALMGESGAGKTTLLNALAQRINFGTVKGTFLVNGQPLPLSFQRATGFAEQQDVHEPTTTVREALRFSALLRQPKEVPIKEKYEYVENILDLLEMEDIAGATVGVQGNGLNEEQRKRLTIGVELASKPELLMFLDEPTSGLDSGAAFNVVRFLRKLADAGQAILCTVHQPSSVLFEHFDELILLKKGGTPVYIGPLGRDSQTMIQYFERNGAPKCSKDRNPAEYMLESIGAGDPNRKEKDWGQVWRDSEESSRIDAEIEQFASERRGSGNEKLADNRSFAMPWATQVLALMKRTFVAYWRTPQYVVGLMALHIFTGLFNAFTFYKLGNTAIDMQSRLFTIFMVLTISPPLIQQLQPRFLQMRDLFVARENNSKIYHWSAWVIAAILAEIPYRLVAGTVFFVCWYFPTGFPRDSPRVGYIWFMLMLFELYYLGFGQAIASFSPNAFLASILVPVFFLFVVSFCGVVVPFAAMPTFWRRWMYHLSPFRYMLEGFLGVLTKDVPVRCAEREFARFTPPQGTTCQNYVQAFIQQAGGYVEEVNGECRFCQYATGEQFAKGFNVEYGHRWGDVGIVIAFIVFNFAVVFVCSWLFLGGLKRLRKRVSKK
ncbi:ABC-2 type transporter-domain-containing protein [Sphaerosporella brunnea]|uniref:ABC-2 type transporter-domain-containing protein n=1 Tax=Sphaerosporella brunnea TaxID=1250544 RepID=A0A5J5ENR2_9PEZI|nr:ABC-2 type transporter-domain-containing protein [Sphaerosporella brunnea]